jgi:lipopolysaccharide export system permease protein
MRTSGVSIFRIIFSVMKAAIIMIIFAVIIGEVGARYLNSQAENLKSAAEMQGDIVNTMNGVWLHQNNRFIQINKAVSTDRLLGVTQYTIAPNHQITSMSYAKSASKTNNGWQLNDVVSTQFDDQKNVSAILAKLQPWVIQFQPQLVRLLQENPDNLSLIKVHELIQYRQKNNLSTSDLSLSFWQRIIQPFSILVLIFLGAPIIFGPLRSVSMGVRLLIGISVGFVFFLANRFFGPISVYYQVSPLIGASLPLIIFLVLGVWMVSRVR